MMLKRIALTSLCSAMALLSACGSSKIKNSEEDPNVVPETPYEINWYFMQDPQKEVAVVEEAVNAYLKDKINATLKLNALTTAQYQDKVPAMIASGEYYDIAFCAAWLLDYPSTATTNAWIPLDEYWDKYMPKTKALLDGHPLESAKINGSVYAVPTNKEFFMQRGWLYRKDLAEKYNIDFDTIKSFQDLEPHLKTIQDNEPDIQYPVDWSSDRMPSAMNIVHTVVSPLHIHPDKHLGKVINALETEEQIQSALIARRLYQNGYVKKDVASANVADFTQRAIDGKTFAYLEFLKPGKAEEVSKDFKFQMAQSEVTPPVFDNSMGSMNAISRTSKNPERAMRFLELFNTDEYLNNLIIYGIEGKHYTKLDSNTVDVIPNSGYTMSGSQWMMGNVFINYLTKIDPKDKYIMLEKYNKEAVTPQYLGFVFDPTNVAQDVAAIKVVWSEYSKQINMGNMDPLPKIEECKAKLKQVGIDRVMEEAQKQFDEFLAAKQ